MVEFFDGSVGEAIKSVQERNRCLLVTVQDDSNACEEMETRLWTDSSVVEAISEAEFTCLMIKADTQDYVYFGSFFPVYVFPTVYILAPNGKPLAYFATSVPKSELLVKVQESASKLQEESSSKKEQKRTSETNAGPTGIPKPVAREEGSTAPDTARSSQTPDSVPSAPAEPTAESSKRPTSEENASPEPIQTEERDARGKGTDVEPPEKTEETTTEDQTSSAAAPTPCESEDASNQGSSASVPAPEHSEGEVGLDSSALTDRAVGAKEEIPKPPEKETTSLCFRLPDSSKLVQNFKRSDSLAEVERFVKEKIGRMKMQCLYPHLSFQTADFDKSLEGLGLHPSATILLVQERSAVREALTPTHRVRSAQYALSDMIRSIGNFFNVIFARIQAFFAGIFNTAQRSVDQRSAPSSTPTTSVQRSAPSRTDAAGFGPSRLATLSDYGQSSSQQQGGGLFQRPAGNQGDQGSAGFRRRGNFTTFSQPSSDDDDEKKTNFWNGNSTQFGGDDNKKK
uniref:UBX domain-containing protein 2 n=1 Tax=Rhodosorus marinus TaxID=101924 RepID=A0A7S2ZSL6_9RHOD|mmetsp:Transcript_31254/g.120370  ORF Transcript_31254/g.120370 Transcript_31254/m.120370 type:complete len:512 (+) Transcript_31254:387-1922(+)|eukprot:CAMPEP_0113957568 /NCGR_PEP_ID=MMETSP0011_2-20120614/2853_1 /TAXON_ID=101924 /ORGANISM="Rhodosorus marinus" /LENGTH=511 /DNA_ID=CAMNT_0000968167 /DNA_START=323 /DNA_END=1858 /DNA_ORIENTATION=+ /assembly_acc=CAM_ASM_000156